jgi:CheY-like chemotaxis protein
LGRADLPVVIMASAYGRGKLMQSGGAGQTNAILLKPVIGTVLDTLLYDTLGLGAAPGNASGAAQRPARAQTLIQGARLLLVEDNPLNQIVARGMLQQAGATVDVVDDGAKALERLRSDAARYDLVLMDVQMPVMDGFAATRAIRDELHLTLPVLAMSAGVTAAEREHCTACGMNDFISKPVEVELMLATIARHLPPAAPPAAPTPEGVFDIDQLLCFGDSDPDQLQALLGLIRDVCGAAPAKFAEARRHWHDGHGPDAKRELHSLRGSIGTLGARRFAQAALVLEKSLADADQTAVPALFDAAEAELQATCAALHSWLAQQDATPAPSAPADSTRLQRWERMLAEQDLGACDAYPSLRPQLAGRLDPATLAALDRAIEQLDFAGARQLLG